MKSIRFFLQILNSRLSLNSQLCVSGFVSIFGYFEYFLVFLSIFRIIYAEVMNCIRIFADFVFKVVSQLTRVIRLKTRGAYFKGMIYHISYFIYEIYFWIAGILLWSRQPTISEENQARTLKIDCDFFLKDGQYLPGGQLSFHFARKNLWFLPHLQNFFQLGPIKTKKNLFF